MHGFGLKKCTNRVVFLPAPDPSRDPQIFPEIDGKKQLPPPGQAGGQVAGGVVVVAGGWLVWMLGGWLWES